MFVHIYMYVLLQSEEAAARSAGCSSEGGGAHLLHKLPGCGGGQTAENNTGTFG